TIMKHDGVYIADGPLPYCAERRAVEHERQRSEAMLLAECNRPRGRRACAGGSNGELSELLGIPDDEALPLPAVQRGQPPVPELSGEKLGPPLLIPEGGKADERKREQ